MWLCGYVAMWLCDKKFCGVLLERIANANKIEADIFDNCEAQFLRVSAFVAFCARMVPFEALGFNS